MMWRSQAVDRRVLAAAIVALAVLGFVLPRAFPWYHPIWGIMSWTLIGAVVASVALALLMRQWRLALASPLLGLAVFLAVLGFAVMSYALPDWYHDSHPVVYLLVGGIYLSLAALLAYLGKLVARPTRLRG